jgi:hypothetical protein
MSQREIVHRYDDPIDLIWIRAAGDLGLDVVRSTEVFAAYDGKGKLTISDPSDFDSDDCLAQMIFHEICHWLVAGRHGNKLPDWGLENVDDRDVIQEYACIRLQAALSSPFGLRNFMAVTTDWRPYWDALPIDPLRDGDDPAIAIAQEAAHLARLKPFAPVLTRSLSATAAIADVMRGVANTSSLWSVARARHRLGSLLSDGSEGKNNAKSVDEVVESDNDFLRCGDCAWAVSGKFGLRCRQHKEPGKKGPLVDAQEQACERWEPKFEANECGSCGACCREGFDLVAVSKRDSFLKSHSELVELRSGEYVVPRPGGICVALDGNGREATPYRCRYYDDRPKNCVDLEVAGDNCLLARRRVGLSR